MTYRRNKVASDIIMSILTAKRYRLGFVSYRRTHLEDRKKHKEVESLAIRMQKCIFIIFLSSLVLNCNIAMIWENLSTFAHLSNLPVFYTCPPNKFVRPFSSLLPKRGDHPTHRPFKLVHPSSLADSSKLSCCYNREPDSISLDQLGWP